MQDFIKFQYQPHCCSLKEILKIKYHNLHLKCHNHLILANESNIYIESSCSYLSSLSAKKWIKWLFKWE